MDELDDMLLGLIYDIDLKDGTMNGSHTSPTAPAFNDSKPVPEEQHLPSRLSALRETVMAALIGAQITLSSIEGHKPTGDPKVGSVDADPDCALSTVAVIQVAADMLLQTTNELRNIVEPRQ